MSESEKIGNTEEVNLFSDPLGALNSQNSESNSPSCAADHQGFERHAPKKELEVSNVPINEISNELKAMKIHENDSLLEEGALDLYVIVDNPEKHVTPMESFMTFRVTTKTTRPSFESSNFHVRRRYNDFLWLKQRLEDNHPTLLIPPLPEKHSLKRLDHFSQEFVRTRAAALQKFMSRLTDHPILSFNKYFIVFISAKQWEFQAARKEGTGLINRLAGSVHNISASYIMRNRLSEHTEMVDYVQSFSEKLSAIDRISQRILREQNEYLSELNQYGPVFTLWSNSEGKLTQALAAVAKALEQCYLLLQTLVTETEAEFSQNLREYILYADTIKGVLRRRDAMQMEYDMCVEELSRKKDEMDQAYKDEIENSVSSDVKSPENQLSHKYVKLKGKISELKEQQEILNDRSACANANLKADMERWQKNKRRDFRKLFTDYADRQITYYKKCLTSWENTLPLIQLTDLKVEDVIINK